MWQRCPLRFHPSRSCSCCGGSRRRTVRGHQPPRPRTVPPAAAPAAAPTAQSAADLQRAACCAAPRLRLKPPAQAAAALRRRSAAAAPLGAAGWETPRDWSGFQFVLATDPCRQEQPSAQPTEGLTGWTGNPPTAAAATLRARLLPRTPLALLPPTLAAAPAQPPVQAWQGRLSAAASRLLHLVAAPDWRSGALVPLPLRSSGSGSLVAMKTGCLQTVRWWQKRGSRPEDCCQTGKLRVAEGRARQRLGRRKWGCCSGTPGCRPRTFLPWMALTRSLKGRTELEGCPRTERIGRPHLALPSPPGRVQSPETRAPQSALGVEPRQASTAAIAHNAWTGPGDPRTGSPRTACSQQTRRVFRSSRVWQRERRPGWHPRWECPRRSRPVKAAKKVKCHLVTAFPSRPVKAVLLRPAATRTCKTSAHEGM